MAFVCKNKNYHLINPGVVNQYRFLHECKILCTSDKMASTPFRPSGLYKEDVTKINEDRFLNFNSSSFSRTKTTFSGHGSVGNPKESTVSSKDPYYWFTDKQFPKSPTHYGARRRSTTPEIVEKKHRRSPEARHHFTFHRKGHSPVYDRRNSRRSKTPVRSRSPHERKSSYHGDSPKERLSFWQRKKHSFGKPRSGYKQHHERSVSPPKRKINLEKKRSPAKPKVAYRRSRSPPVREEKRQSTYKTNQLIHEDRKYTNEQRSRQEKQLSPPVQYSGSAGVSLSNSVLTYEDYPEEVEKLQTKLTTSKPEHKEKVSFPDISTNNTLLDKSKSLITVFDPETLDSIKVVEKSNKPVWQSEEPFSSTYMGIDYPDEEPDQKTVVSQFVPSHMSVLKSQPVEMQEYDNFDAEPSSYSWVGEFLDEEENLAETENDNKIKQMYDTSLKSQFGNENRHKVETSGDPKPVQHSSGSYTKDKRPDNRIYRMHDSSVEMERRESPPSSKQYFIERSSSLERKSKSMTSREKSPLRHNLHEDHYVSNEKSSKISYVHEERNRGKQMSENERYRKDAERSLNEKSSKLSHEHETYKTSKGQALEISYQHEEKSNLKGHPQKISFKLGKGETRQFGPSGSVGSATTEIPASAQNESIDGYELTDDEMANYDLAKDDFEAINRICNIFKKQQAIEEKSKESKDDFDLDIKKKEPETYVNDVRKYGTDHHDSESQLYPHGDKSRLMAYEEPQHGHNRHYRRFEQYERNENRGVAKEGYPRETYMYRGLEQMDKREVLYSRKDENISEMDPPVGKIHSEFPRNSSRHVVSKDAPLPKDERFWTKGVQETKMKFENMTDRDGTTTAIPGLDGELLSDSDESDENYNDFWGLKYISWFSENILETKQFEAFAHSACPASVANNLTELPLRFLRHLANGDKHAIRCIPKQSNKAKQLLKYVGMYKSLTNGMQTLCENLRMNNIPENDEGFVKVQPLHSELLQGSRKVVDYNKEDTVLTTPEKDVMQSHKTVKKSDAFSGRDFKITVITSGSAPTPQISKQIEVIHSTNKRKELDEDSKVTAHVRPQFKSTLIEVSQEARLPKPVPTSYHVPQQTTMHASHSNAHNGGRVIEMDSHNIKITREEADWKKHKMSPSEPYIASQNLTRTIQVPITTVSAIPSRDSQFVKSSYTEKRDDFVKRRNEEIKSNQEGYASERDPPSRWSQRPNHVGQQGKIEHSSSRTTSYERTFHPDMPKIVRSTRSVATEEERLHTYSSTRKPGETGRKLLRRDFGEKNTKQNNQNTPASRSSRDEKHYSQNSNESQQSHSKPLSRRGSSGSTKRQPSHGSLDTDSKDTLPVKSQRLSSSHSTKSSGHSKQGSSKPLDRKHPKTEQHSGSEKSNLHSLSTKCTGKEDSSKKVGTAQERRPSVTSKSSHEKLKEDTSSKDASIDQRKAVNAQNSNPCFGGTRKRLVVYDNYPKKPPVLNTVQKTNLPDFKKYVKDLALKLLNLKYDFEKYDSTKIRDFIHDASLFKPRNSKLPRAYGKEHVIHILRSYFQNAEREKMIPDWLRRQIKQKGSSWCEISLKTFKSLQEAVFRQCSRQFMRADNLSACPMLSGVVNKFEITYPQYAGDVKGIVQLWCWTNLASAVIDSSSKSRVTRSSKAADKDTEQTDKVLKQWLCTVYDCPPFQASKYKNMEILSNKKWGTRGKNQVIDLVVSWFLEGYFRACYSHLESQKRDSVSGKSSVSDSAKSGKSNAKKEKEQTEEDMDLDDMDVMEDDLVEPPSKEVIGFFICWFAMRTYKCRFVLAVQSYGNGTYV
uniref:Leucine-rich repeat-containing protein 4B-like n=1 Tax=Phallusia mammillata TaxID=59560 RepID=A0A6F9DJ76_9ASCI|nr:leucine-rich repeat-containing protein 4B-like [Phallusia mammillata]